MAKEKTKKAKRAKKDSFVVTDSEDDVDRRPKKKRKRERKPQRSYIGTGNFDSA